MAELSPEQQASRQKAGIIDQIQAIPFTPAQWGFLGKLAETIGRDVRLSAFGDFLWDNPLDDGNADGREAALERLRALTMTEQQWILVGRFAAVIHNDDVLSFFRVLFRRGLSSEGA